VLDLSRVVSGPLCGRLLADLGADVVKVEPPDGDVTRIAPPHVDGVSVYFAQMNAGKRNVCIDLKAPGGPVLIARLAEQCDVLIENFRPGVLTKAGLGFEELLSRNPRLVYCSITGWGQEGPWRDRKSFAPLVHAETGTMELAGRMRDRPPEQEVQIHGDTYPALMAANAITAALFQRTRTGRGQHLDISMGETLTYMNEWAAVELQRHHGSRAPFDIWDQPVFQLGDGTAVALVGSPERLFASWVGALGRADLATDPRFITQKALADHHDEVMGVLTELTARVPDYPTLQAMMESGPLLIAQVRSLADLADTPWAEFRSLVSEVAPHVRVPAAPWQSSGATIGVTGPPAQQGEHNAEVISEWTDLTTAEIDALSSDGTLRFS
jgi:CoA:oxalate CoA-transferase